MNKATQSILVPVTTSVKQAMKRLEETSQKILFVVGSDSELVGSLTDGDIRRWILAEGSLDAVVESVCNKQPYSVDQAYNLESIKKIMVDKHINCIPVVNGRNEIAELLFWEDLFKDESMVEPQHVTLPVVIMAGGKGTRLDPFTKILPKPLIPIGEKTIIEMIIDSFLTYSVSQFYISVNYKSKIIKSFFEELDPPYTIEYIHENKPLGTAGSLKYLLGKVQDSFFVTNCDILINSNYAELAEHHNSHANDITIVASLKNFHIPYGICEIVNGGTLTRITEKPEYDFLVNTGMYVLRASTLNLIPDNETFHMTDLIDAVKGHGGKVGVFPISGDAWLDTGEWAEYKNTLKHLMSD